MRTLYHLWLTPSCRAVRLALDEKGLEYELVLEKVWERRGEFLALDPAGEVPLLEEADGAVIAGAGAILEYLEDVYKAPPLIGSAPLVRAEVRRLTAWFGDKFAREVSDHIYGEKFVKRFLAKGEPDSQAVRAGLANIRTHLDYIAYLTERRNWLAGEEFSLADIMAGAHLSVIDYMGDVPWSKHEAAKEWYARIKSRPSFRSLLEDYIPSFAPPKHYADLDF
ncbi:MAG: glutathione S-transferase [Rhodospirillaceae bacterium]|nr:glutathione S-transferase [Rhodospirillaceae bacterium]